MEDKKKRLIIDIISYSVVSIIGILLVIAVLNMKNFSSLAVPMSYMALSDAMIIPGVFFSGIGAMIFASNNGAFDMIAFGIKSLGSRMSGNKEFKKKYDSYFDYCKEKRLNRLPFGFMLFPGLVFLAGCFYYAYLFMTFVQ